MNNNKLIAEFMGWVFNEHGIVQNESNPTLQTSITGHKISDFNQFNKSWDWLMAVVEKIENMPKLFVEIEEQECSIYHIDMYKPVVLLFASTKIQAVYRAVIEFIKWLNKQEK